MKLNTVFCGQYTEQFFERLINKESKSDHKIRALIGPINRDSPNLGI